jgi:hypothetical protein
MTDTPIDRIVYHFGDASVPPDDHRSYAITVTPESVRVVVDSYGEILADKTFPIAAGRFDDLRRSLADRKIGPCERGGDDEGGTGGTSETLSYHHGERKLFSGTVHHCGGKDSGTLGGDVAGFAADVKGLVPDLEALLR